MSREGYASVQEQLLQIDASRDNLRVGAIDDMRAAHDMTRV